MIREPIRDLGELAKEAERDYSHQDLIRDLYAYLGGEVEGFPVDDSGGILGSKQVHELYGLRGEKVTRTTMINFLSQNFTSNDGDLYPNRIQRIEAAVSTFPEPVFDAATKFLYVDRKFPQLSTEIREENLVTELEKSFVLDPKLNIYWEQAGKLAHFLLDGTADSKIVYLDRTGKAISNNGDIGLGGNQSVQEAVNRFSRHNQVSGFSYFDDGLLTIPWKFNYSDFKEPVEEREDCLVSAMTRMSLLFHFRSSKDGICAKFPKFSGLFQKQVDLNLYGWMQAYGLGERASTR